MEIVGQALPLTASIEAEIEWVLEAQANLVLVLGHARKRVVAEFADELPCDISAP